MPGAYKEMFSHVWNGVVFRDCTIPVFTPKTDSSFVCGIKIDAAFDEPFAVPAFETDLGLRRTSA